RHPAASLEKSQAKASAKSARHRTVLHPELAENERIGVHGFLDNLLQAAADAVAAAGTGAQETGGPGGLEARGHLAALHGIDARVVGAGKEKDGRIMGAIRHMVIGRIGEKGLELSLVLDGAEFGNVKGAVG